MLGLEQGVAVLSREGCSGPGCPSTTKSGPPGKMGRSGGDCENVAYVEGWQCCLRALIWVKLVIWVNVASDDIYDSMYPTVTV